MHFTSEEYYQIALNQSSGLNAHELAIRSLDKAIKVNPNFSAAWTLKGILIATMPIHSETIACFNKAIELDSKNEEAYFQRGNSLLYLKRFEEALNDLQRAIALNEDFKQEYFQALASCQYQLKDFDACVKTCLALRDFYFEDFTAYTLLTNSLWHLNRNEEAAQVAKKYAYVNSQSADALNNWGFYLLEQGNYKKAASVFDEALNCVPEHSYANNNKGFALFKLGDITSGLELVTYSIELDISNSYAYKNRAIIHLTEERRIDAKVDLLRAKDIGYTELFNDEVEYLLNTEFNL